MSVGTEDFRQGMRRLVGSVCIVTAGGAEGPTAGMTATAVCSVSADPPTLLICVHRGSASHASILAAGGFAVNVLAIEDRELANRFGGRLAPIQKFEVGAWRLSGAAPVLDTALASFECNISHHVEVGTHGIVFGQIERITVRPQSAQPLLYAHGNYGGFAGYAAARGADLLWVPDWGGTSVDGWGE